MPAAKEKQAGKGRFVPSPVRVKRWLLNTALLVVLLLGFSVAYSGLIDPQTLPLQVVQIRGDFRYLERQMLMQAVDGEARGGFFGVDVKAVRSAARALPWVKDAEVRRVWPHTLRITVKEQMPVARWGEKGVLNPAGELFYPPVKSIPEGLPRLAGPDGMEGGMLDRYLAMRQRLEPLGLRILSLRQTPRQAWFVGLAGGMTLKLGTRRTRARLARFMRLYPQLEMAGKGRPEVVDLRYPNGAVVRWSQGGGDLSEHLNAGERPAIRVEKNTGLA